MPVYHWRKHLFWRFILLLKDLVSFSKSIIVFVYSRYIDYSTLTYNNTKANTVCGRNYFEIWNTNLIIYSLHIIYPLSSEENETWYEVWKPRRNMILDKIQKDKMSLVALQHNKNAKEVSENSFPLDKLVHLTYKRKYIP